jgi:hypothetical protein
MHVLLRAGSCAGGLRELHRCLKHGGRLLMFEHVRSRIGLIGIMQDLCTPLSRLFGPDMSTSTSNTPPTTTAIPGVRSGRPEAPEQSPTEACFCLTTALKPS